MVGSLVEIGLGSINMSLTAANGTTLVRSLIKEATASFWTDAEVTLYLTAAEQTIWAKYSPWLYETYKSWHDFAITATADFTISTAIASDVYKIANILVKEDGDKLLYIHHDEMYKYKDWTTGYPVAWTYKGKTKVTLFPTPSFVDTDYLECFYMPTYTDLTSFPDSLQMLCCVEAAILAKTKDEGVDQYLIELRNWHEQAAMLDLTMSSMGKVEVFPDFMEEDTLE